MLRQIKTQTYQSYPTTYQYLNDWDNYVLALMGPFGSGKSSACALKLRCIAERQEPNAAGVRDTRQAVVRNTYPELKDTTLKTVCDWLPPDVFGTINHSRMIYTMHYKLPDGTTVHSELLFRALDKPTDVKHLLSLELTSAWFNEVREIPWPIVEAMLGRIDRWPSRREEAGPTWTGLLLDTNPPDEDHWLFHMFEKKRPDGWKLRKQPGGQSPHAENLEHLGPNYYTRLRASMTADAAKVYVDGCYGFVQDGRPVYPEYNDTIMSREFEPWLSSENETMRIGLDFGLTPAAVIGQRGALGQWRIIDELVSSRMGAKQLALALAPVLAKYPGYKFEIVGDPSGEQGASIDSEQTVFSILRANGIQAVPTTTNDPVMRREAGRAPMMRMIDGEPGLLIHQRCLQLRKALGGKFQYRRLQVAGGARFADRVDKNEFSHVAEAYEYMLLGGGENPKLSQNQPAQGPIAMKQDWSPYD